MNWLNLITGFNRKNMTPGIKSTDSNLASQAGAEFLVVALGNPGKKYRLTRHNAGWLWLDHHFDEGSYEFDKYGNYDYKIISQSGYTLNLVKPRTFMNQSGIAVRSALQKFHLNPTQLQVIHDDVDLPVGMYKHSYDRGDGGHNGVKSIVTCIGTQAFGRIRLGVRPLEVSPQVKASDYVLSKFRQSEIDLIQKIPLETLWC